ncbi:hypothetical protein [Nostoc sp.]|uniref:hypothetical protein n=1 Tax=Nostoc sp. TaxID=1180 RepID=UPI002FFBD30D
MEIAQLSLEVNHPNAMFRLCDRPTVLWASTAGIGVAIAVATGSNIMILASTTYLQLTIK